MRKFFIDRLFEIVQVEPRLGIETASHTIQAVIFHIEFAGAVHACREQMSADAAVVAPAGGHVDVQIRGPVLAGKVARQAGHLHLLGEGLVHILLGGRVEETERGLRDGGQPADDAAAYVFLFAECGQGRRDLAVVVHAQEVSPV